MIMTGMRLKSMMMDGMNTQIKINKQNLKGSLIATFFN